ncbi:MAG TPA: DinB family protein [bacterium]|nr:DinB family protein [bacterium]
MIDYVRNILSGQFEAALAMLNEAMERCPEQRWDGKIAKYPFWHVAYHTLCFVDLYLSPSEEAFEPRDLHPRGLEEFDAEFPSRRFGQRELIAYTAICRQKAADTLAFETFETLQRGSGFPWLPFTRGELHIYNIRHIQHHAGQLGAFLRRGEEALQDPKALTWAKTGWRQPVGS